MNYSLSLPSVTVVIPTRNNLEFLTPCIHSLLAQSVSDLEIIVVDNGSPDDTITRLEKVFPQIDIIKVGYNAFFCESINIGIKEARADYIAIINDDTVIDNKWIENALSPFHYIDDNVGAVATKILSMRNTDLIDSAGQHLLVNGRAGNIGWGEKNNHKNYSFICETFSPSAAGAMYKKSALNKVNGFDNKLVAYYDDVDVAFRMQLLGYKCIYTPLAIMHHYGSSTPKNPQWALRLVERNMIINLIKNMPLGLLKKYLYNILLANLVPIRLSFWDVDKPVTYKRSWLNWLRGKLVPKSIIKHALYERRKIQASSVVSDEYIEKLLTKYSLLNFHL